MWWIRLFILIVIVAGFAWFIVRAAEWMTKHKKEHPDTTIFRRIVKMINNLGN